MFEQFNQQFRPDRILGYLFVLVLFGAFWGSFFVVSPGEAVVIVRLGTISRVCGVGLNFKLPFIEDKVRYSVRIQKVEYSADSASNDLQSVTVVVAHNFSIDPKKVAQIYRLLGESRSGDGQGALEEKVVQPAVYEAVKGSVAQFSAEELITKRAALRDAIKRSLRERLLSFGVITEDIAIMNIKFSKQFDQAIEEKLVAEQQALKAKRDLERIKTEAEQKIATAKAEAESLRIQKTEVTPYMVQLRWIEKWDGHLPHVAGAQNLFYGIK